MYTSLAGVYDRLMDDIDYRKWADFYMRLIRAAGVEPLSIYECACGTGSLTQELAAYPVRLAASDLSEDMLRRTAEKLRKRGLRVPVVHTDMRSFEVPRRVDAVICACDGVNYLCEEDGVSAFFTRAFAALKSGGVLAFDISTREKLLAEDGQIFCDERDDVACIWKNGMDAEKRVLRMDVSLYIRTSGEMYERTEETHRLRAWTADELTALLAGAGFTDIRFYADGEQIPPRENEKRIHCTSKRP